MALTDCWASKSVSCTMPSAGSVAAPLSSAPPLPLPLSPASTGPTASAGLGDEGFMIRQYTLNDQSGIAIVANTDIGVLYGVFHFLRLLQTHQSLQSLDITSIPALRYRVLDHWDNLNRTVERGYAGLSIFDWWTLPIYKDKRYTDYARANASVGINGSVLNSVNASPIILTPAWLKKAAALADIFRPYGIRVYLSVNFSSPIDHRRITDGRSAGPRRTSLVEKESG